MNERFPNGMTGRCGAVVEKGLVYAVVYVPECLDETAVPPEVTLS